MGLSWAVTRERIPPLETMFLITPYFSVWEGCDPVKVAISTLKMGEKWTIWRESERMNT